MRLGIRITLCLGSGRPSCIPTSIPTPTPSLQMGAPLCPSLSASALTSPPGCPGRRLRGVLHGRGARAGLQLEGCRVRLLEGLRSCKSEAQVGMGVRDCMLSR